MARRLRPVGADLAGPAGSLPPRLRAARLRGVSPRAPGPGDVSRLRLTFVARTAAPSARVHRAPAEDVTAWPG